MTKKYTLPTHYDGWPVDRVSGQPIRYITQDGRRLCSWCFGNNRGLCADKFSKEWFVVRHELADKPCDECQKMGAKEGDTDEKK